VLIDPHLVFDGHAYRLKLTAAETKSAELTMPLRH
jgi:hypothetical protein